MNSGGDITQLLNRWSAGDEAARDRVAPLIYDELKQIARGVFSRENSRLTLQPTALVHEAYEKLVGVDLEWQDRSHFFALAARMMRRLLVNHANHRNAQKRGAGALRVTLQESDLPSSDGDEEVLALDDALNRLAKHDARQSQVLEMHYFGGLTQPEIGQVLEISESTVRREFKLARIWLRKLLSETRDSG
ncbi:MAG: sigma-70 family RNA polymerase sigma factor [Pseudomonadota bacterium]